jgi:hypothetical protein
MSGSDPLSALVSAVTFTDVTTDVIAVGALGVVLYVSYVGIKWILRLVKTI